MVLSTSIYSIIFLYPLHWVERFKWSCVLVSPIWIIIPDPYRCVPDRVVMFLISQHNRFQIPFSFRHKSVKSRVIRGFSWPFSSITLPVVSKFFKLSFYPSLKWFWRQPYLFIKKSGKYLIKFLNHRKISLGF